MENTFSLQGKVIIVTGGTGILGRSFINGIIAAGGSVGILGRKKEIAEQRAKEITERGGKAVALISDVTDEQQLRDAKKKMLDTFGKIDGLVNAAGGNIPEAVLQPNEDIFAMNISGMKKALDLNLWGTILPTQIFGDELAKNGGGSIVNISSVTSKRAITKVLGYAMGKAAVDYYTQWMAVELANRYGDAVRMNAIVPGFFLTEQNKSLLTNDDGSYTDRGKSVLKQTPFKRFGQPNELEGALVWLLSDASKYVTGTMVYADGGFSINSGV